MNYHRTCERCQRQSFATLEQIILYGSRLTCPTCGQVMDYAAKQAAQPGISPEAKRAWAAVGIVALIVSLFVLADKVDQWAT